MAEGDPLGPGKAPQTWELLYAPPEFLLVPESPREQWPRWSDFPNLSSPRLMVSPSVELYLFLREHYPGHYPRYRPYCYRDIARSISNYILARKCVLFKNLDMTRCCLGEDRLGAVLGLTTASRDEVSAAIKRQLVVLGLAYDLADWTLTPPDGTFDVRDPNVQISPRPMVQGFQQLPPLIRPVALRPTPQASSNQGCGMGRAGMTPATVPCTNSQNHPEAGGQQSRPATAPGGISSSPANQAPAAPPGATPTAQGPLRFPAGTFGPVGPMAHAGRPTHLLTPANSGRTFNVTSVGRNGQGPFRFYTTPSPAQLKVTIATENGAIPGRFIRQVVEDLDGPADRRATEAAKAASLGSDTLEQRIRDRLQTHQAVLSSVRCVIGGLEKIRADILAMGSSTPPTPTPAAPDTSSTSKDTIPAETTSPAVPRPTTPNPDKTGDDQDTVRSTAGCPEESKQDPKIDPAEPRSLYIADYELPDSSDEESDDESSQETSKDHRSEAKPENRKRKPSGEPEGSKDPDPKKGKFDPPRI